MIARIWKGEVPLDRSDEYLERMRTIAIPDYRSTDGNQGAFALRRLHEDRAEFLMLTFWDSLESIKAFNGDDISVAKYYDFDAEVLLEMVPNADHYEIYNDGGSTVSTSARSWFLEVDSEMGVAQATEPIARIDVTSRVFCQSARSLRCRGRVGSLRGSWRFRCDRSDGRR